MAGEEERPLPVRPALHAKQHSIPQATGGETIPVRIRWSKDLVVVVKSLGRFTVR